MAQGESVSRMMSQQLTKAADGTLVAIGNFEGTATGYGMVFTTLTFPLPQGGASSGTCTIMAQAFPEDRPWVTGSGDGTWEQIEGKNRWKLRFPIVEGSDGSRNRVEGELDLATRSFTAQFSDV